MFVASNQNLDVLVDHYTADGLISPKEIAGDLLDVGAPPDTEEIARDLLESLEEGGIIDIRGRDVILKETGENFGSERDLISDLEDHEVIRDIHREMTFLKRTVSHVQRDLKKAHSLLE